MNMFGEMVVVELFVFLWDLFVVSLIAFHIVEVLLIDSMSLSKEDFLAERTKLLNLFLCFLKFQIFFPFLR